jgi:predicted amidophosphoribosyltransferase
VISSFRLLCAVCGDRIASGVICGPCSASIGIFDSLFCGTCAARLPDGRKTCHTDAPYLLDAAASYDDDAVRVLVHTLKFQEVEAAAAPVADILADYIKKIGAKLDGYIVTPVPLSVRCRRRAARGEAHTQKSVTPYPKVARVFCLGATAGEYP